MKKHLLRTICIAFVLTLCLPLVACDMQFGGLIGELITSDIIPEESISMELITGNYHETLLPDEPIPEPDTEVETDVNIGEVDTEIEFTGQDTTREDTVVDSIDEITTEPPVLIDPVMVRYSFDILRLKKGEQSNDGAFFTPGTSMSWNNIAKIDDYEAEYLSVFGWAGFLAATPGTFGYQIDDQEPVFSGAFFMEPEQAVIDVSLASGGKSGSRYDIQIPIRELSGTHTIKAIVKDEAGTIEVITEFTLDKAVDPNAPVFVYSASDLITASNNSSDIDSAILSPDESYVTLTTGTVGDPYYTLFMNSQPGYVANCIVVKYRTTEENKLGHLFVGSGQGPTGAVDMSPVVAYEADGSWHLAIFDLSEVEAVKNGVINYLRWDVFNTGTNQVIDLGYIAAFTSIEAAQMYDERLADVYYNSYNVPQSQWTISGHIPNIVAVTHSQHGAIIQIAGIESGALLHAGAINVGELDLSKYSKVKITYGMDVGSSTQNHYNSSANNRIILTNADTNNRLSPPDEMIVAAATYEFPNSYWKLVEIEIDLTGVDYNGPVYITWDSLSGTSMLFGSIEFIE